jgi:hypothetical protein
MAGPMVLGLTVGITFVIVGGIVVGFTAGIATVRGVVVGTVLGIVVGVVFAFLFGLVFAVSGRYLLAEVELRRSAGTPVRLIRFLEDARTRGVPRTVGPLYQFRHARLQDRLTEPPR